MLSLVTRPGALTVAYLEGRRKPSLGPVPLFFMANVLVFAAESLLRSSVFATPLAMHLEKQPWSPLAQAWVTERITALDTTLVAASRRWCSVTASLCSR